VINYLLSKENRGAGPCCQATAYIPQEKPLQEYGQLVQEDCTTQVIVRIIASNKIITQGFEKRVWKGHLDVWPRISATEINYFVLRPSLQVMQALPCHLLSCQWQAEQEAAEVRLIKLWLQIVSGGERERSCIQPSICWGLQNLLQCYKTLTL